MRVRSFLYYWFPVIIYAGIIFYLSSLSQIPSSGITISNMDKLEHAVEYFILALLLLRALKHSLVKRPFLMSIIIASLYGITDEIHQLFVPGRFFAVSDMLANTFGASLILLYFLIKHTKSYKTKKAIQ